MVVQLPGMRAVTTDTDVVQQGVQRLYAGGPGTMFCHNEGWNDEGWDVLEKEKINIEVTKLPYTDRFQTDYLKIYLCT